MITDRTYREIANEVIGDSESGMFAYKSGPVLVEIFNSYFNFDDVYQGNLSRWFYVVEKIKSIGLESFLQMFLSSKYLRNYEGFFRNNVESGINERLNRFNLILEKEDYVLVRESESKYRLRAIPDEEEIGSGGYAKVYFVSNMNLARKQLRFEYRNDKKIRERFRNEHKITQSLNDVPGIMKVYSFDEENCSYLMQLCDMTLENYIKQDDCSNEDKINIIFRILEIMAAVHSRKIIHRDLSPTNIFMNDGKLIIGDFGLGRDFDADHSRLTMMTSQVGQYLYAAPEQLESLKNSTMQSDVYSLGKVINFVMTGYPTGSNHKFYGIVSKATSEKQHNRYLDASEMLKNIERVINIDYQKKLIETVKLSLAKSHYNNDTDEYILTLEDQELSDFLAQNKNADYAILHLVNSRPNVTHEIIEKLLEGIRNGYPWNQYDRFSNLAYQIILSKSDIPYNARLDSAKLLNYVAYSVNRFNAQNLISKLIQHGVDPLIEEELDIQ